jgi:hypothetical protein
MTSEKTARESASGGEQGPWGNPGVFFADDPSASFSLVRSLRRACEHASVALSVGPRIRVNLIGEGIGTVPDMSSEIFASGDPFASDTGVRLKALAGVF